MQGVSSVVGSPGSIVHLNRICPCCTEEVIPMETVQLVLSVITPLLLLGLGFVVTRSNRRFEEALARGTERQELRFTSYGELWRRMRPLAIYDDSSVNRKTMGDMSKEFSDWYFSPNGGLMLTTFNRYLYFALQGLLARVCEETEEEWTADRGDGQEEDIFKKLLNQKELDHAQALLDQIGQVEPKDWPGPRLEELASKWGDQVATLADGWTELSARQRFAVLQQVSSVLRTGLTKDVESRLR
jgi:hypothetical protein